MFCGCAHPAFCSTLVSGVIFCQDSNVAQGTGNVGPSNALVQIENIWPAMRCAAKKFGADNRGFPRGWNDEPLTLHLVPRIQWNLQNENFLTGIVNIFKTLKEGAVSFPGASWHSTLRTRDLCTYTHQLWKKGSSGLGLRSADFQTMTAHCILLPTDLTSPTAPGRKGREIKPRHKRLLQAKCPVTGN